MRRNSPYTLLIIFFAVSCGTSYQATTLTYEGYRIEKSAAADSSLVKMLQPYAATLNITMNKVIGFSNSNLFAKQPESGLGNFMADAIKLMAEKKFGKKVDAGFVNQGGIRSYISKGNITVGKIFELMPFDNLVVLQELKGSILQQFLDKTAADGGWPVSVGVTMGIKNKKAIQVQIGGKAIDPEATYVIANSDYVANGGSDCEMLRRIPKQDKGYLMRDALIDYVTTFTKQGIPVDYTIENRVVYVVD
ncbi:MAG: 5'-nucleotidase [Sediminibacterium sp.]|nr:5'-nucleotidase [Sediminibacterium sp.]MDP3667481.1 5'-nucleotidase [Sediminibacterium sp.]